MVDPNIYIIDADETRVVFERQVAFTETFPSSAVLFQTLRDVLTATLPPDSKEYWLIKFCSRVMSSSMPLLHNPVTYQVLVDPLQCVRDPIKELQVTRRIELLYYPSKSYFYRKKNPLGDNHDTKPAS